MQVVLVLAAPRKNMTFNQHGLRGDRAVMMVRKLTGFLKRGYSRTTGEGYEDAALQWGRQNPTMAQACLQPPPLTLQAESSLEIKDWHDYWKWRSWDFSKVNNEYSIKRSSSGGSLLSAQALTTHVLTAPVTMATCLFKDDGSSFYGKNRSASREPADDVTFKICCLGARAESMLPVEYWKEFLMLSQYYLSKDEGTILNDSQKFLLDFVGPDIVVRPSVTLSGASALPSITLRWMYQGKFHDWYRQRMATSSLIHEQHLDYDAYVFFNPGVGHPHLQKDWAPTVSLLLSTSPNVSKSNATFLWTAHSELDAKRDGDCLQHRYSLDALASGVPLYKENPFASRIKYQDPFDSSHLVQVNHSHYVFKKP